MNTTKYQIGAIVALKSHPYFQDEDNAYVVLAGDPQLLSPLMVIAEVLKENKSAYDEATGDEIVNESGFQCRCIWFSQKSHQFEDAWFSSKFLKVIMERVINNNIRIGASVCFKTVSIELGKLKSSFRQSGIELPNKTITAHLPFVSPVMEVIGKARNESKEPLIDLKNGSIKRKVSNTLLKCKYYNHYSDKFSDVLLPFEALTEVESIKQEDLDFIKQLIKDKKYLRINLLEENFPETIIKPIRIIYTNGFYSLEAFDCIRNKQLDLDLLKHNLHLPNNILDDLFSYSLPSFNDIRSIISISKVRIKKRIKNGTYIKIRYKNFEEKLTERVIRDVVFRDVVDESGEIHEYLHGFCLLRNAERTFRIDKIQKVEFFNF